MNILIACEESQAVCKTFRKLGHNAYSCDILPSSGGHPEWHYNSDMFGIIENRGGVLENGNENYIKIFLNTTYFIDIDQYLCSGWCWNNNT